MAENIEQASAVEPKNELALIALDSSAACAEAVVELIEQAKRQISIFSPSLSPRIFDTENVLDACQTFALKHQYTHINILIDERCTMHRTGYGLLRLYHRCMSSISIHKVDPEFVRRDDEFVCIDQAGYFHRHDIYSTQAHYSLETSFRTKELMRVFSNAWETSTLDQNLRQQLL
jgi:hypothetical protein